MPRSKPPRRKKPIVDPHRPMLQRMVEEGHVFADGALIYCRMALNADDTERTKEIAAEAYKAGASATFQLMVRMQDDTGNDDEITGDDMRRMELLDAEAMEIDRFLMAKYAETEGSA